GFAPASLMIPEVAFARRGAETWITVNAAVRGGQDPDLTRARIALSSRLRDEPWFCFEQPDREHTALAALGCVHELTASGESRFRELDARWRELSSHARDDGASGPPGAGLVAVGGFAFAAQGGDSPAWTGFAPASLMIPEVAFARRGAETWITVNAAVRGGQDPDLTRARIEARLESLSERPLPLLDPAPTGRFRVHSPMPASHYEEAVARAVERIRAGEAQKLVLAREVRVQAPSDHDAAAVFDVLRGGFSSCFVYAVGRGEATFIGATPELLVRRQGQRASTVALAGSTRRSADPSVDDHLGEALLRDDKNRHENLIVAQRIAKALAPYSLWVTVAPEPVLVRVANIQHLAAPIRAQLKSPVGVLELAGALHPTPAVGGEPDAVAQRLIPALEGLDRGWYAGTVGWTDTGLDGEFCVTLRCALLRGREASCFAGCGIVADSDPASELAETETKLQALLPVLAG
ncbi:MAG TPA: isochorismate synthase, partial [Solirubrobacteraceae bacterium]|nr:isochorismate synthase [Solirubrobacteraceae bacterium]